jgi:hypothetical protein
MSSYSPSLRIELIDTGSQVGTWGQTTNQNLGTLLEAGVCGYTSVSVTSANQAFTALNGAPDQSRNMSIALTTTTSAAFNVYAPPSPKTYIIYNASAHAATIFNSTVIGNTTAAGTGVTVPAGRTMAVWSDGTNFRVQNDNLIGNLVGNVTGNVTGQLNGTITSGTTGVTQPFGTNNTTLSTTAFVQAALQALHPIGSIYINATNATNPGTLLGFGTWVAFGAGRVPVGFNSSDPLFDTAEETGGSKDAIVVSHTHTVTSSGTTGGQSAGHTHTFSGDTGGQSADHTHSGTTATAGAHSHVLTNATGDVGGTAERWRIGGSKGTTAQDLVTTDVQGAHTHTITTGGVSSNHTHGYSGTTSGVSSDHTHNVTVSGTTASAGSSGTNANLQPYITVFMWKRTA